MSPYNSTIHLAVSSSVDEAAQNLAHKQLAIMGQNAWLTLDLGAIPLKDTVVYSYTSELLSELQLYALIPVEIQNYFEVVNHNSCINLTTYIESQIRVCVVKLLTTAGQMGVKRILTDKLG